ncbi:hypothetical protein EUGRSUZ_E03237 [Eucalyptus grandis]|uniref:Uncharacterized protein n=2 Tax=Eucalyptus grandis TaxID=71139 RepID=A0ACC3KZ76_EUCGR|nr:hypothetical protein EUGRSUZ_E03237 [Eucalyptus grandis]
MWRGSNTGKWETDPVPLGREHDEQHSADGSDPHRQRRQHLPSLVRWRRVEAAHHVLVEKRDRPKHQYRHDRVRKVYEPQPVLILELRRERVQPVDHPQALSVKERRKLDRPQRSTRPAVMARLAGSQWPWFENIGDRSWNARTVPVGKRLAKWAVLSNVCLMAFCIKFLLSASSSFRSGRVCSVELSSRTLISISSVANAKPKS